MTPTPLELCEDFLAHIPPRRNLDAVVTDGYLCVPRGPGGSIVQRIRLADAGQAHAAVERVREIARAAERPRAFWWVGELSTPADLDDLLAAEGLRPDADEPRLASLVLQREPRGALRRSRSYTSRQWMTSSRRRKSTCSPWRSRRRSGSVSAKATVRSGRG